MRELITFVGEPCSGKSTIMRYMNEYIILSSAQILINNNYDLSDGNYVSDEIVTELMIDEINKYERIILDGYPRTKQQLISLYDNNLQLDVVYHIITPYNILIQRAKDRLTCSNCHMSYTISDFKRPQIDGICDECGGLLKRRPDDEEDLFKIRLINYDKYTLPMLNEFSNYDIPVVNIDGTQSLDNIKKLVLRK